MSRVVIGDADETTLVDFPKLTRVSTEGAIQTRAIIGGSAQSLFFWMHQLAPNAAIYWDQPPVAHMTYVWSGEGNSNGETLNVDSTLIVEHKARGGFKAGPSGAILGHFHEREGVESYASRP